jgi:hypothetical protein
MSYTVRSVINNFVDGTMYLTCEGSISCYPGFIELGDGLVIRNATCPIGSLVIKKWSPCKACSYLGKDSLKRSYFHGSPRSTITQIDSKMKTVKKEVMGCETLSDAQVRFGLHSIGKQTNKHQLGRGIIIAHIFVVAFLDKSMHPLPTLKCDYQECSVDFGALSGKFDFLIMET